MNYELVRRMEARFQGTILGKAGSGLYRWWRALTVESRKIDLTRKHGSKLPTISLGSLIALESSMKLTHYTFAPGTATPLEHVMMRGLAITLAPCHFLEIGCLRGEMLANMEFFTKSRTALTLSQQQMFDRGYCKSITETSMMCVRDQPWQDSGGQQGDGVINVVLDDSRCYPFRSLSKYRQFNLVFIDGDHAYEMVRSDTQKVLDACAKDAVIVWHDYSLGDCTAPVNWPVFAGILDGLPRRMWHNLYHVNNTLCAVLLPDSMLDHVKRLDSPNHPEEVFSVTISKK